MGRLGASGVSFANAAQFDGGADRSYCYYPEGWRHLNAYEYRCVYTYILDICVYTYIYIYIHTYILDIHKHIYIYIHSIGTKSDL